MPPRLIYCLLLCLPSLLSAHTNADWLAQFHEKYPNATPLIVIKSGEFDTSAWKNFNNPEITNDHVAVPHKLPIISKKVYEDFTFCFEFKVSPGANSGFFLRYPSDAKIGGSGYEGMCELQMLDDTAPQFAKLEPFQYHGSAYGIKAAKKGHQRPLGEWNYQTITVKGHRIIVNLNDTEILNADLTETPPPFKGKKHLGHANLSGHLALGGHHEGIVYRNMYLAELPKDSFSDVSAILSRHCLACHNDQSKLRNGGNLSVETLANIIKGGNKGSALTPGDPEKSPLYTTLTLPESDPAAMPPAKRFPRLSEKDQKVIYDWIKDGAKWPEGQTISYKKTLAGPGTIDPVEMDRVKKIRAKIIATQAAEANAAYSEKIAHSRVKIKMIPIPAGEVLMQGQDAEDTFTAELDAFWLAEKELPWDIYSLFMEPKLVRDKDGNPRNTPETVNPDELILAQPSPPYHPMSFGMGVRRHPAIAMTHHAANKFCQWLSYQTGRFYRLPTEAEWEYAARAGRDTSYPWGNDVDHDAATSIAWYAENSNGSYQRLGKKQPNPWGLYDMTGNIMEWTLDAHTPNRRLTLGEKDRIKNPWIRSTKPYPHIAKGGHWNGEIELLAFDKQSLSSPIWKASDPQIPKSIWYHTNVMWIGLRPLSTATVPSAEDMYHYWNNGVAYD